MISMSYASLEWETWTLEAVECQKSVTRSKEPRTEMRVYKFLQEVVGVFAQEHDDPADAKYRSIAICVTSLKLLKSCRDAGEAREEDVYNRDRVQWDLLTGYRTCLIVGHHCGKYCG